RFRPPPRERTTPTSCSMWLEPEEKRLARFSGASAVDCVGRRRARRAAQSPAARPILRRPAVIPTHRREPQRLVEFSSVPPWIVRGAENDDGLCNSRRLARSSDGVHSIGRIGSNNAFRPILGRFGTDTERRREMTATCTVFGGSKKKKTSRRSFGNLP